MQSFITSDWALEFSECAKFFLVVLLWGDLQAGIYHKHMTAGPFSDSVTTTLCAKNIRNNSI